MISRRVFAGSLAAGALLKAAGEEVLWAGIDEAGNLLRRRSVSPGELVQLCLRRIERLNGRLNAFVTVTGEQALEHAKTLEAEARAGRWRGPLHGVPVALKDLYDTAGVRTTAGSRQWADRIPDRDAEVVRLLKAAGAIVLGKLNMDEFAYNFTGETSMFGFSRNPWNLLRSPGGSSGGSAVAVATGMCFAALGSDTGGSIRLPAALCGITGYKPAYNSVSTSGAAPLAWSLDHAGPMCRSARDASLMFAAMSGKPVPAVLVKPLKAGVPRALFFDGLEPDVAKIVEDAIGAVGRLTAGAHEVVLPPLAMSKEVPDVPATYATVITAEAYAFHEGLLREHPERYDPGTRKSIEMGAAVTAPQYIRARLEMDRLRAESGRLFENADVLLTPAAPGAAFEFGAGRLVFLRNTAPWNLFGLPSISIPCGFTPAGLPVGLQITGRAGGDAAVLAVAQAYQKATDWHKRRPPVE